MSAAVLEARALAYAHPDAAPLFADVSLRLCEGEVVSVLGASGVGKSTLLRLLAGLHAPRSGEVLLRGSRLTSTAPRIALAFQDPRLLPWLDLEANVAFGLDFARQPRLSRAERERRVAKAIERVGLAHATKLKPAALSGGMAQRAAFARCLARNPEVLLLDEPFAALDAVTRRDLQQLLLSLACEQRVSILLSTHDIDEAITLSDRILLLGGQPARLDHAWRVERDAEPEPVRRDILRALSGAPGLTMENSHV